MLERIAIPYKVDNKKRATRNEVIPEGINAATGLVTTVRDFARFDAAIDEALLLRAETLDVAWSPDTTESRQTALPTGLGWFVQTYRGEPVVWHFGLIANGYSSLVVKLPSRHLTFILFANSDGLSATAPARRRRRHTLTLCDPVPPPLHLGRPCGRPTESWLFSESSSSASPQPRAPSGSSRRFSASPSRATRRCSITSRPRARVHWTFGGSVAFLGAGPVGVEGLVVYTPGFFQQDNPPSIDGEVRPTSSRAARWPSWATSS